MVAATPAGPDFASGVGDLVAELLGFREFGCGKWTATRPVVQWICGDGVCCTFDLGGVVRPDRNDWATFGTYGPADAAVVGFLECV